MFEIPKMYPLSYLPGALDTTFQTLKPMQVFFELLKGCPRFSCLISDLQPILEEKVYSKISEINMKIKVRSRMGS